MIRALTVIAAIVALAVTASPASAGSSNRPTPHTLGAGKDRGWVKATATGFKDGTSNTLESALLKPRPKVNSNGIIAILIG